MVFEIFAEKERIILKPQEKTKRDKLADEFNSINLDNFEKYKQVTLSPFFNMPSNPQLILRQLTQV